jgi:hypothetical protein
MTSVYVRATVEAAKQIHDEIPDIKFIWRLVQFDNFSEISLFKIESEHIPAELDNKLVQMMFHRQADGNIAMTAFLEKDQSLLGKVGVVEGKKSRKPRKKLTDG